MSEENNSSSESVSNPQVMYRCKKCRRIVATQESIITHERGKGESCFKWNKRSGNSQGIENKPADCTSIFVEPMKWMETLQDGHVEEKLVCIGCKARLGSFNWAGMQCSCGAWKPKFGLWNREC
ncbi:hypothetical protein Csa_019710 [Cucumis sativus]|nr:hypothetical protein Csa_019710 [Cucumis sativus]